MTTIWLVLCRTAALVALAASAALYVQYLNPAEASFCGLESGCEAVRRSGFSYIGSPLVSMPLLGLLGYGAVFLVALRDPNGRALRLLATGGGAVAIALIVAQALVVKAFCWLCVTVDVAAVLAAVFAWLHARGEATRQDPLASWTWYALAAVALTAPPVWSQVKPAPPVPDVIARLYEPGKINVVEFADFECPYCRALHPVLKEELSQYPKEQVNFVRMNVPLPSHPHAEPAAKAYLCAAAQGKGEAMADALVATDFEDPVRRLAVTVGVDAQKFDRCVDDPATARRIEHETGVLREAGMVGLPTTYIGGKRFIGMVDPAAIRDALARAARGESETGVPAPVFVALVAAVVAALAWFGRRPRDILPHGATS